MEKESGIGRFTRLSETTQRHLRRVYENLTVTAILASLACYMFIQGSLPEPGLAAILLMVACLLGALFIPNQPGNATIRYGSLYGFGFTQGWLAAPLVDNFLLVDPQAVLLASLGAAAIFFSFSMSALYSPRREYLYLGALLGSLLGKTSPSPSKTDTELKNLGVSALASLANSFLHSAAIESAELYLGLFAFSFYVLYDTQVIVERAEAGNTDDVRHALTLYTDLADIFIRLLLVMSRNRNTRDRDDENSRRHGNGYGRTRGFRGRGSFL